MGCPEATSCLTAIGEVSVGEVPQEIYVFDLGGKEKRRNYAMGDSITAEGLAQRILDVNVLDDRQLQSVFGEFGSRNVPIRGVSAGPLARGLLTNYQLNRLVAEAGYRDGFFYGDYKVLYARRRRHFARVFRAVRQGRGQGLRRESAPKESQQRSRKPRESSHDSRAFAARANLEEHSIHPNIVPFTKSIPKG